MPASVRRESIRILKPAHGLAPGLLWLFQIALPMRYRLRPRGMIH